MPDCVDFYAMVRKEHAEKFCEHVDFRPEDAEDRGNGWVEFRDDQMPWGGEEACEKAAKDGVDFIAEHGQHYMWPAAWMIGHQSEYFHLVVPYYEGGGWPTIPVSKSTSGWWLDPHERDAVLKPLEIAEQYAKEAEAEMWSGYIPPDEPDFGEMLEARLDCLNNETIIREMGFHDPENVGLLLDYIRVKLSEEE